MRTSDRPSVRALALSAALLGLSACGGQAGTSPTSDASPAAAGSPATSGAAGASTPSRDQASRAARAFGDFAVGDLPGARVPWADEVVLRVGGTQVARLAPREAARRASWEGCPADVATYEGRACPVSVLEPLVDLGSDGTTVEVEKGWPTSVGCSRVDGVEPGVGTALSLRPPTQRRDCFSDFAVLLSVDDAGRVDVVELALSGP